MDDFDDMDLFAEVKIPKKPGSKAKTPEKKKKFVPQEEQRQFIESMFEEYKKQFEEKLSEKDRVIKQLADRALRGQNNRGR